MPLADPAHPPLLNNSIISYGGAVLIAFYGCLLIGILRRDPIFREAFTLLGWKELDFCTVWAAGQLAALGNATAAYDWPAVHELMSNTLGATSVGYFNPFYYPPWFLLALAPLGLLPFGGAAVIWLVATLAAYLLAVQRILPGRTALIVALAAPTVLSNLFVGQNGLLAAGLLGGALAMLDVSPMIAGVLIGLLSYKPHFGILLPLFLAITCRMRVFASAAATVAGLAGIATALFGGEVFLAFARAVSIAGDANLQHTHLSGPNWSDLASIYGLMRTIGFGSAGAWCGHLCVALEAAAAALWIAASGARTDLKAATIATAVVIVTPYSELNDLAILTVAMAFLVRDGLPEGLRGAEWAALTAVFLMPLMYVLAPSIGWLGDDRLVWLAGPLMCAILAVVIGRRVLADPGFIRRGNAGEMLIKPAESGA